MSSRSRSTFTAFWNLFRDETDANEQHVAEIAALRAQLQSIQAGETEKIKAVQQQLTKSSEAYEKRIADLNRDIAAEKTRVENQIKDNGKLQSEFQALVARHDAYKKEAEGTLAETTARLRAQIAELNKNVEEGAKKYSALEARFTSLQTEYTQDLNALGKNVASIDKTVDSLVPRLSSAAASLATLGRDVDSLEKNFTASSAKIQSVQGAVDAVEKAVGSVGARAGTLEKQFTTLDRDFDQMQKTTITNLSAALQNVTTLATSLDKAQDAAEKTVGAIGARTTILEGQFVNLNKFAENVEKTVIPNLSAFIASYKQTTAQINADMDKAQDATLKITTALGSRTTALEGQFVTLGKQMDTQMTRAVATDSRLAALTSLVDKNDKDSDARAGVLQKSIDTKTDALEKQFDGFEKSTIANLSTLTTHLRSVSQNTEKAMDALEKRSVQMEASLSRAFHADLDLFEKSTLSQLSLVNTTLKTLSNLVFTNDKTGDAVEKRVASLDKLFVQLSAAQDKTGDAVVSMGKSFEARSVALEKQFSTLNADVAQNKTVLVSVRNVVLSLSAMDLDVANLRKNNAGLSASFVDMQKEFTITQTSVQTVITNFAAFSKDLKLLDGRVDALEKVVNNNAICFGKTCYTAADFARAFNTASEVPAGTIVAFNGSAAKIPSGWVVCDGKNNTPDLRDRFVLGAGAKYKQGSSGGSDAVALEDENVPSQMIAARTLTTPASSSTNVDVLAPYDKKNAPKDIGKGTSVKIMNPYYALVYIMKA